MKTQLTPQEALQCLDLVTRPENAGKLTRIDYAQTEYALQALAAFINTVLQPLDKPKEEPPGNPATEETKEVET